MAVRMACITLTLSLSGKKKPMYYKRRLQYALQGDSRDACEVSRDGRPGYPEGEVCSRTSL